MLTTWLEEDAPDAEVNTISRTATTHAIAAASVGGTNDDATTTVTIPSCKPTIEDDTGLDSRESPSPGTTPSQMCPSSPLVSLPTQRYHRLRSLDLCGGCGRTEPTPDHVRCERCYRIRHDYARANRMKLLHERRVRAALARAFVARGREVVAALEAGVPLPAGSVTPIESTQLWPRRLRKLSRRKRLYVCPPFPQRYN